MARKSHLLPSGHVGTRDLIWSAIRALSIESKGGAFTKRDIEDRAFRLRQESERHGVTFAGERHIKAETIKPFLQGLIRAGYIFSESVMSPKFAVPPERATYRLVNDIGIEAPRVDRTGRTIDDEGRTDLWRTMNVLGDFSIEELRHATMPVTPRRSAMNYVQYLVLAGYLAMTVKNAPGRDARYRLVQAKYSGPLAPQVLKVRHVYDPNLGRVVWHPEAA